jgi:hypothetical protein
MPIAPLIVGDERAATRLCQGALDRGVFAQAIRPPTVPAGSSRLRLAAMASHTQSELELAASALAEAAREVGLAPEELIAPPPERVPERVPLQAPERDVAYAQTPFGVAEPLRDAPFDVERDGELPEVALSASEGRWLAVTVDASAAERGPASEGEEPSAAPSAPFDLEREPSGARAA